MSEKNTDDIEKIWMKRVRNLAGFLGMILPWVSLIGAILVARTKGFPDGFWGELSISETYYVTPPLVGILTTASVVLMCYKGYNLKDHVISALAGIFGLMIVLFPCNCPAASDIVGFFQLPVKISNTIHCASAVAFFLLLSYMSLFQFTKGADSSKKHIKNIIFKVCGIGMLCALALMVIPVEFFAKTFIVEAIALTFFGVSWLVKGEAFGFLSDDKA
ncbi:hypothetical protein [Fibrobacter sp.]|uniref:hypothetical protein n=1 Tax=Fibrobacter sp. TaxID=35828 RepID=UPI0038644894